METIEQFQSNKNRSTLKFTYKLQEGVTKIECYGIKLSRIANCSKSVSDRAEELVSYMRPMVKVSFFLCFTYSSDVPFIFLRIYRT